VTFYCVFKNGQLRTNVYYILQTSYRLSLRWKLFLVRYRECWVCEQYWQFCISDVLLCFQNWKSNYSIIIFYINKLQTLFLKCLITSSERYRIMGMCTVLPNCKNELLMHMMKTFKTVIFKLMQISQLHNLIVLSWCKNCLSPAVMFKS